MDCQECPEGYKVSYTPMAPGNYLISIKYGGPQHIVGSPFKAKVSGGSKDHRPCWDCLSVLELGVPRSFPSLVLRALAQTGENRASGVFDWGFADVSLTLCAGPRLSGGHSLHETSSVLVETVSKSSSMGGAFASLPKFSSDGSKVISRGAGLSKAFVGQKNTFTVDCSKAGEEQL